MGVGVSWHLLSYVNAEGGNGSQFAEDTTDRFTFAARNLSET